MPSTFEPIELCLMTKLDIFNTRRNINIARDDWWNTWDDILSQGKMSYCMSGYVVAMDPPPHIDKTAQIDKFRKAIDKKSKHGFQGHYFPSSDDSKQYNLNCHVLIISSFDNDDEQWR